MIHINIPFLLSQFYSLLKIFIQNKKQKNRIRKMELTRYFDNMIIILFFILFVFIYHQDSKFELNCWIWVIHLNISFLHRQFYYLFQIFIQKKKRLEKMELIRYFDIIRLILYIRNIFQNTILHPILKMHFQYKLCILDVNKTKNKK